MPFKLSLQNTFLRRLVPGIVLINLLVAALVGFSLWINFNEHQRRAEITTQNLVNVLAQNLDSTLAQIDLGLQIAAEEIERQIVEDVPDSTRLNAFMARLQDRLPWVIGLRATDAQGWLSYGTDLPTDFNLTMADRLYFTEHRDHADLGLFINQPVLSRVNKVWVINCVRRLNYPDGRFAGVVFANISLANFEKMFAVVDIGTRGVINLRDKEMGLVAAYPAPKDLAASIGRTDIAPQYRQRLDQGQTAATFHTGGAFDETSRVVSYRKLASAPLYVSVGLSNADFLADWRHEVWHLSALAGLFFLISGCAGWLIARTWQRQQAIIEHLAREEEKFHIVADYPYDWEYWEDADRQLRYISPSCQRVTGYPASAFFENPSLLTQIIHPDDRELLARHKHDADHPRPCEQDFRIIRRDGEIRWLSHCCQAAFSDDGRYVGHRVSNHDITDRRLFEIEINKLAQAADQNPTGILVTDLQGTLLYTNMAYTRITGYAFGEVYGKPHRELIASEVTELEFQACQRTLNAGKIWSKTLKNRHKNGKLYWEQLIASPIYDNTFTICNYLYLRSDITEMKKNEEELRRYKDHLEEEIQQRTTDLIVARNAAEAANKAKSVFLANMSHELRTPLNAILGFSTMMRRDPSISPSQRENLDIINRSGEHLLKLINDVLEMAKIEAGRLQLEIAAFDLGALVRDVTEMMQIRALEKDLRLLLDQSSEFPRYIKSDEARLRQILINIISNAVKFTEQGGVTLRLGVRNNARYHLVIEVEDSGPGISPKDQARLFEPFVQLSESTMQQQGTGLGLAISREFVRMLGGDIGVDSTLGKGSRFRIDLPVELATPDDILPTSAKAFGQVQGLLPGQDHYRILIVEDQRENQLLLNKLMTELGLETKIAENGEQCLEIFQAWHPDLIWMDRRMPVMDGLEATKQLRGLPEGQKVKIVAVTASAFKEQQQEMLDAGMDDFVRKPYRFDEIYDCLARQLGVEYSYHDETGAETIPDTNATSPQLASLSSELRDELRQAAENLDCERIATLIKQIKIGDKTLARQLTQLAEGFDFPAILKCLNTVDDESRSP